MAEQIKISNVVTPKGASILFGTGDVTISGNNVTPETPKYEAYDIIVTNENDLPIPARQIIHESQKQTVENYLTELDTNKMEKVNPTGSGSFSLNRLNDSEIGEYSFAEGYETSAVGEGSHAEGSQTYTAGTASHVEGFGSTILASEAATIIEPYAMALVAGTASHAEGYQTSADGPAAHSEGQYTQALADTSHAEGNHTIASGGSSHAEGSYTQAASTQGHAEGYKTVTTNEDISFTAPEVSDPMTNGQAAHAEGYYTVAYGPMSHVEGYYTKASGMAAHAEGSETHAVGSDSHAEGSGTTANGQMSHAEGSSTTTNGVYSHAEGYNTTAIGKGSHVEGQSTEASGEYSHAEGNNTVAASSYQHVQGKFNIPDDSSHYAHIVGNGDDELQQSNAHTIDWEGNAWFAGDVYVSSTSGIEKDAGSVKLVTETELNNKKCYQVGSTTPTDTTLLWIDTNSTTGGLKYYDDDSSNWKHVPFAWVD